MKPANFNKIPKISVIIPTLNEEKYIRGILYSLQNQNFENFELIISDDKSNDRTVEIAKKYGAKVVINKRIGEYFSRNMGAECAQGEILVFTSADAIFPPHTLNKVSEIFSEDRKCVASYAPLFPYDGPIWSKIEYIAFYGITFIVSKIFRESHASSTFMAVRKEYFCRTHGFQDTMSADGILVRELDKMGKVRACFDFWVPISSRRIRKLGLLGFNKHFKNLTIAIFLPFLRKSKLYQKWLTDLHRKHDKSRQLETR